MVPMARWQASSHARQASAQMRQWLWCMACCPHSLAQTRQASAQAGFDRLLDDTLVAAGAALQRSAQSRLSRMHWISAATDFSPRQASAQAVQACAQSWQRSMHRSSASLMLPSTRGWAAIISWVCIRISVRAVDGGSVVQCPLQGRGRCRSPPCGARPLSDEGRDLCRRRERRRSRAIRPP